MRPPRSRSAVGALLGLALGACQPVPQPSWSPGIEGTPRPPSGWIRPTPTPPVPPLPVRSGPPSRDLSKSAPRTIRFEQDGEVYTVGWVYLPRTGRSYPVLGLRAAMNGTVQIEMLWGRSQDDFSLEIRRPDGELVSASRSGLKETTRLFLLEGQKATVYLTRYSTQNVAPRLMLRFSASGWFQGDGDSIEAEAQPGEPPAPLSPTPDLRFSVLELPPSEAPATTPTPEAAAPESPDDLVAAMDSEPTEPPAPPSPTPVLAPRPREVRTHKAPTQARAVREPSGRREAGSTARKAGRDKPSAATASEPVRPRDRGRGRPAPTAVPAAARPTTAPAAGSKAGGSAQPAGGSEASGPDVAEVGQPQKGMRISPRGEATHVQLGAEANRLFGRQAIAVELPEARLEITVPRGFDVQVTDEQGRRVPLAKIKVFDAWEGIPGTEYSFLSESYGTKPLPSGRYAVEVQGRPGAARFRKSGRAAEDRDLASRFGAQLVLIKRQY
jgi:hypothetical protein